MKTIIVPTDFSDASNNAAAYGLKMAMETGASLLLFHAFQVPVSVTDIPIVLLSVEDLQKDANSRVLALQRQLEISSKGMAKINSEAVLGDTVDELEKIAARTEPSAIIMGSRGETGIERKLFGSTTLKTVRHLSWPVIVVPMGKTFHGIKKIGLACDFKEVAETIPSQAIISFAKIFNATLFVLHVSKDKKEFAENEVQQFRQMFGELQTEVEVMSEEKLEDAINRFEKEKNLDLLIVIPKKHKLLEGLFQKSHTRQILFGSQVPVMCIHA
jgi:nucleotide-binding universal stress UspA family protein